MADITLSQLEAYADANGMTGAFDATTGTIDLAALTGDPIDGTSGFAESILKMATVARQVAVQEQTALSTYGAVSYAVQNATDTEPPKVRHQVTLQAVSGFSSDDATAL